MMNPREELNDLARACWNGACNVHGITRSLNEVLQAEAFPKDDPALGLVVGQIAFITGQGLGPTVETIDAARKAGLIQ